MRKDKSHIGELGCNRLKEIKPLSAEHLWIHVLVKSASSAMELLESMAAKLLNS